MTSSRAPYGASLGATVSGSQTRFSAWTSAGSCALRLYDERGEERATLPLAPSGDGLFELTLSNAGHGTRYKFVLDGQAFPDPYARFLPDGVHGPAMVVESRYAFRAKKGFARPLEEHVIYELHVGTFTEAGTYRGARERLAELVRLGVTAIELMPVAAFAGQRGWGYDGVALFSPFASYGAPDELRALVDAAHELGLSVLLDVVYNHFGPSGNYLAAYHPAYFDHTIQNLWGDAPNYAHPAMRALAIDNALYWLESFRFDGLRLDAVHAIVDASERHILRELSDAVRERMPDKLLIAEDDRNDPAIVSVSGLDAVWADDFHHQVRVTLTGERDGYYAAFEPGVARLARTIERGWYYDGLLDPTSGKPRGRPASELSAARFIYCIQNHDQVGNRALGDRLSHVVDLEAYCMVTTILLFLPMTPLLFMGQEWGASTPFMFFTDHDPELGKLVSKGRREEFKHFRAFTDAALREHIPDPQAEQTFTRSRLDWDERESEPHARILELYRALLALRRSDAVLRGSGRADMESDEVAPGILRVRRCAEGDQRVLLANFGPHAVDLAHIDLPSESSLLVESRPLAAGQWLAPHTAAVFGARAIGASA